MKNLVTCILVIALFGICDWAQAQSVVAAPGIDIWTAAEQGNIEAIQQHVSVGTDLNAKAPEGGDTPLIVAARFGQTEAARLLIENGVNPNARNNDGNTALHLAAWYCRTETVKLLLDKDAEVNAKNIRWETPLDGVASPWSQEREGVYRKAKEIRQIQLDLERIKAARPQVAAILRRSGGIVSSLWAAARQGNIEAIKQLVSTGTDLNAKEQAGGDTPLIVAVRFGQTEAARLLIENGANPNARNNKGVTALHEAAWYCRTEIVKLLLDKDAEVNAKNIKWETPLDWVASPWSQQLEEFYRYIEGLLGIQLDLERIKAARPQVAAMLRKSGGKIGGGLWGAARQGNIEAIKQLVLAGTDLNAKASAGGSTPLFTAAAYGQTEAARLLIENGANPNARNNKGETALHLAALYCRTEIVKLLLNKGAEVNAKSAKGETPLDWVTSPWSPWWEESYREWGKLLQIPLDLERIKATRPQVAAILRRSGGTVSSLWTAAMRDYIEVIKQHVSAGTDLNAKEPAGGNTPLIIAAAYGHTEAARLLIDNGANLNARNNDGYTALHAAAGLCHTDIVKLLLDKDAEVNTKDIRRKTPLDIVASPWSRELEEFYRYIERLLGIPLDLERIKATRSQVAAILRESGGELGPEAPDDAIWNFVSTVFYGSARSVAAGFKHADAYFYGEQKDTGLWRDTVNRLGDAVSRLTDRKGGFHLLVTLIGLVVIIAIGLAARWLFRRTTTGMQEKILNAVRLGKLQLLGRVLARMLLDVLGIGIYMLVTFIIFAIFFREGTANYMIVSIYLIRSYYVIVLALGAKVIFAPQAAALRLFPMEDRAATFLYKWILRIIFIAMFFAGAGEIFHYFGVHEQLYLLMHSSGGIFVILAMVIMIWQSRQWVARAIRTQGVDAGSGGGSLRAAFARNWHYFAGLYVLVAGGIWTAKALNQENVRVLNLILSIFLIPIVIGIDHWVQRLLKTAAGKARETIEPSSDEPAKIDEQAEAAGKMDWTQYVPLIRRFFRIFLLAFFIFVSLHLWGIDILIGRMFTRSASIIVLILLLSFITWQFITARIDKRLGVEMPDNDEEMEEGGRGGSRIGTLLVLLRKFVLSVLFVVVSLIILDSLGVNIGPLIAGAGIIGIAIGFGSQTLVRDILSGVFFLIDDAFRVGDYIEAGGIKGMVQHISLRSVKLRHPRGMVFTIPFGDMGAVQNFSRDYIITKLDVRVRYDADVEKIRKIVKRIGKELEQDEEIGPVLLSPIKSQGVREMDDSAMILRVKFKTPPGEQFVVRREVYRLIQERFREHGIEFAHRNVTVYLPPEASQTTSDEERDKGEASAGAPDKKIIEAGAAAAIAAAQVDEDVKKPKGQ